MWCNQTRLLLQRNENIDVFTSLVYIFGMSEKQNKKGRESMFVYFMGKAEIHSFMQCMLLQPVNAL